MKIELPSIDQGKRMLTIELPIEMVGIDCKRYLWIGVDGILHNTIESKRTLLKLRKMVESCLESME